MGCASPALKPDPPPATVIDQKRPNVCAASVPVFEAPLGASSSQLDMAHQQYALQLGRIIECFIELTK
jgi:hypothetical protein